MSLATFRGDAPWVCKVHFAYDDNLNLYFRSLKSRRHSQEIANNPYVAGNSIDKYQLGQPPTGIYFEGTAELLEPGEVQGLAAKCIQGRLMPPTDILADAANEDGHQFYKITVKNWYAFGAFDGQPAGKHQLVWNGGKK